MPRQWIAYDPDAWGLVDAQGELLATVWREHPDRWAGKLSRSDSTVHGTLEQVRVAMQDAAMLTTGAA